MESYISKIPTEVSLIILSNIEDYKDLLYITDIIKLENLDYYNLVQIKLSNLFPIKLLFHKVIEYDWRNLYFSIIKEKYCIGKSVISDTIINFILDINRFDLLINHRNLKISEWMSNHLDNDEYFKMSLALISLYCGGTPISKVKEYLKFNKISRDDYLTFLNELSDRLVDTIDSNLMNYMNRSTGVYGRNVKIDDILNKFYN